MGWPTDAQIDQAAETLTGMAEIRGLDRGRAVFSPDLQHVEWFEIGQDTGGAIGSVEAYIPSAGSYDERAQLFDRCRHEVSEGLFQRDCSSARTLPHFFEHVKEHGDDPAHLRAMVGWLHDEVAKRDWQERIDNEWPPLSLVGEEN